MKRNQAMAKAKKLARETGEVYFVVHDSYDGRDSDLAWFAVDEDELQDYYADCKPVAAFEE